MESSDVSIDVEQNVSSRDPFAHEKASRHDAPDHTVAEATIPNGVEEKAEPSKGMLKSSSSAPRFQVAPVSAGKDAL